MASPTCTLDVWKRLAKELVFKMTYAELMAANCVMVNAGSGVLVSAMSQDYSYVLTARHALEDHNVLTDHRGQPIRIIDVHRHPDAAHDEKYDCAVIQVEYVPDIKQSSLPAGSLEARAFLSLAGFPTLDRKGESPIKHYDGHLTSVAEDLMVFTVDGIPGHDSIVGMSGGGVYCLYDNHPYLVGVEFRMDRDTPEQQSGRVQCQGLNRFEEIIQAKKLAHMVPCFLECFSRLKNEIFSFNVISPQNVQKLQEKLGALADVLIAGGLPAPYELMVKYQRSLLVTTELPGAMQDKQLWVAYFEFVIICALVDGAPVLDEAYLEALERRRRFLYSSSSENWLRNLPEILRSARHMLDAKGTMVVASPQEDARELPEDSHLEYVLDDIGSVPTSGSMLRIDNINDPVYKTYTVTHMKGLRNKYVVLKEWEYGKAMPSAQLNIFREYYNEVIK